VYPSSAILANLAILADCKISELRVLNRGRRFESLSLRHYLKRPLLNSLTSGISDDLQADNCSIRASIFFGRRGLATRFTVSLAVFLLLIAPLLCDAQTATCTNWTFFHSFSPSGINRWNTVVGSAQQSNGTIAGYIRYSEWCHQNLYCAECSSAHQLDLSYPAQHPRCDRRLVPRREPKRPWLTSFRLQHGDFGLSRLSRDYPYRNQLLELDSGFLGSGRLQSAL